MGSSPGKPGATTDKLVFEMTQEALCPEPRVFVSVENLEAVYAALGQKNCKRISIWGSDNMPIIERSNDKGPFPCEGFIILPRTEDALLIPTLKAKKEIKGKPLLVASLDDLP